MKRPLSLLILLSAALSVSAQETLTWYTVDLPPLYILSGPNQGKGQLDLLTAFLRDKLPEYSHRIEAANIPRVMERLKGTELSVFAGAQKNAEREARALFSAPFLASQPPVLVIPRADVASLGGALDPRGAVDLDLWLRDHSLGLVAGRSYTAPVDSLLADRADPARLVRRYTPTELAGGLLTMLTAKRVDGILSFRTELLGLPGVETVTTYPLQGVPEFVPLYLIANKSPAGEALIRKINALLKTYWNDPVMRGRALYPDTEFVRQFLARGYRD